MPESDRWAALPFEIPESCGVIDEQGHVLARPQFFPCTLPIEDPHDSGVHISRQPYGEYSFPVKP